MAEAWRICPARGCPDYIPESKRYCPKHARAHDKARGSKRERGYDAGYNAMRKAFEPEVAAGKSNCWRCTGLIQPGSEWHLGHDDHDRGIIRGPEHAHCNLSAAGKASHA